MYVCTYVYWTFILAFTSSYHVLTYMVKVNFNIIYLTCVLIRPTHNTRIYVLQHTTTEHNESSMRCAHVYHTKTQSQGTPITNNEQVYKAHNSCYAHWLAKQPMKHSYTCQTVKSNVSICTSFTVVSGFLVICRREYFTLDIPTYLNLTWWRPPQQCGNFTHNFFSAATSMVHVWTIYIRTIGFAWWGPILKIICVHRTACFVQLLHGYSIDFEDFYIEHPLG